MKGHLLNMPKGAGVCNDTRPYAIVDCHFATLDIPQGCPAYDIGVRTSYARAIRSAVSNVVSEIGVPCNVFVHERLLAIMADDPQFMRIHPVVSEGRRVGVILGLNVFEASAEELSCEPGEYKIVVASRDNPKLETSWAIMVLIHEGALE